MERRERSPKIPNELKKDAEVRAFLFVVVSQGVKEWLQQK
jgi:hypothetical protein